MSKFKRECQSALATALTIMLVLSMMMGVFSLSASADENNNFPTVLNKPVLVYRDAWWTNGTLSNNVFSTISIRLDDSNSNFNISDITDIRYHYTVEDDGISRDDQARWYIADRFGAVLVNVGTLISSYEGFSSNDDYFRSSTSRKQFLFVLESLGRSSLSLDVYFKNGDVMPIEVGVVDEKLVSSTRSTAWETAGSILVRLAHSKLIEDEDFYSLGNAIAGVQSVNDNTTNKYYVDIDSKDEVKIPMNEMSDTVELVQTRVGSNVVYNSYGSVDFGDNIPSVSNGQADVGTVYYLPNGAYASNDDPTELVNYIQQKGIFYPVGEIHGNPINLWNFYADDSYDISSLYQENFGDFVDNLYFYSDFYTNLDGDSGSKTNEFAKILIYQKNYGGTNYNIGTDFESYPEGSFSYINSNGYHSLYPSYDRGYYSVTPFLLTFDGDHTSSVRFLNNLKSFLENNSNAPLTQYIKYNYFYGYTNNDYPVSYYYEDSERARSSSYQTGKGYGGTQRWFQLYYSYKDQYGKAQIGNTEILSSQDSTDVSSGIRRVINDFENNNYTDETLLNIYFTPADFNKKKALFIPDEKAYQAYDQLIAIAENSGLTIKNSQSIMPRRDYDNCEKISFKDLITSLGVEIGTAQEQRVRPYLTYYYNSYDEETKTTGSWDYADPNKTHALHEDYELVQYGDFVFNTKDSSFPIITDTYYDTLFDSDNEKNEGDEPNPDPDPENTNSNEETKEENKREKGVKFKVDDIRTNIRKGVSYNVVNQVQLGLVSDYYASGRYGGKMYDTQYTDVGYGYNFVSNGNNSYSNGVLSDSNHDMRLGEWLGYSYTDDNGQKKMFTKGNVYYVGGEFITHSNTVTTGSHYFVGVTYDNDGFMNTTRIIDSVAKKYGTGPTTHWGVKDGRDAAMRNTEYKWGEMVFVSKPDPVVDLSYNKANQTISWNKPVDEGFGVKGKNKTATDDYIKIEDYTVKVTDETGKEVGSANIPRAGLNNVTYDICKLIKKSGTYKIAVTANNPIGDSKESVLEDVVVYIADMDVKMTPDQPVHDEDDIVEFKETITNTGRVKLTNVIVYQSLTGEYVPQNGVTIKGSKASVAEIDVGKSVEILYRVPANKAKDGILTNTIEVTTNDQKLSETATASVKIIHHNIKMGLTAVSDKSVYTDEDTVVIKSTIENKGEEILNDITVSNSIAGGKYTNLDNEKVTVMEDNNIIINTLDIGDTVTLNYEIPAKDIETGKNGAVQSTVNATNGKLSSSDLVEFKVVRPAITIKASPAKNEYNNDEDVTYTALIKNTGNIPLNDVTIGASIKGKFAENEFGQINSKGDMVISELPVGKSISLTYTVRSENTTFGTMNNTFTVSAKQDAMAEAETEIKVAFYGIDVMKTVDSETYVVGDTVVFHTKITNTGDGELKDIYITESTDGTFKLSEGALIYTDDTIVISAIKPGESYSYDFYVTATEDNIVDGVVSGESVVSVDDKLVGSDSASAKVYTQSLTFTKTVNEDNEYRRGDKVVWTDTVTNTGECDLTNVVITESLIGEFDKEFETTANSITIPKIAKGDSVEVQFTTTVTPADVKDRMYECTAEVTAKEHLTDSASASVKIIGPAVKVGKYADKPVYGKGERVVFTEVITNSGDKPLTNVMVTENLDGKFMRYDKSFKVDGRTLTIPNIAVGDSVVLTYAIDRSLIEGNRVESTVTVTCDQEVTDSATNIVMLDDTSKDNTDTNTSNDNTDTNTSKDNTDTNTSKDNTDTNTSKDNTDTNTSKDNTDTNTSKDNTDTNTSKDNTDTNTSKDNTDTNTSKDNTETDTTKDNTDTNTSKDNTETDTTKGDTETDTTKGNTETDTSTDNSDTDTSGKESEDLPTKRHLMGDVNMDGKVTGMDSLLIQRYAIGLTKLNRVQQFLADVTQDGKVTAADAMNILRYTIKLKTSSNTGEKVDIPKELLSKEQ